MIVSIEPIDVSMPWLEISAWIAGAEPRLVCTVTLSPFLV